MRKKDYNNTYNNNKPENYAEHTNAATSSYTKTGESGIIRTENKDFVQMNIKYQAELAELALTEPSATAIFLLMATRMENNNTYITSKQKLAKALHKNPDTIKRALKILKEKNFITLYFKVSGNQGAAYFINPHICCKVSAAQKQYLIEKYLTFTKDKIYQANEEIVDIKALIDKDRLVLKSDEKKQLDTLNRLDNVELHAMMQLPLLIKGKSQEEILEMINFLKNEIPLTDEEQKKAEQDIENRKKGIELMKERRRMIEEESREVEQLKMAEHKAETAKNSDVGVVDVLLSSYWQDAFIKENENDKNGKRND